MTVCFCSSDCVKGYYKRAKAHAAVWNEKEAKRDFNMVAQLDFTLASLVSRELKALSERMKEKYWEEKEKYWNMLETKESKNEGEGEELEGKQEEEEEGDQDGESVTTEREDQAREEKGTGESPSKCDGGHKEELSPEGTSNEEEASSLEISPYASNKTEEKDWQQMLRLVMLLQKEGNFLIKEKSFEDAAAKFKEAVGYVDVLQDMVSVTDTVHWHVWL